MINNMKKYKSNAGKMIFYAWLWSVLAIVGGIIIGIVIKVNGGSFWDAGIGLIAFPILVFFIDLFAHWKTVILEEDTLKVKRFLRPTRSFNILDYDINIFYVDHSLFSLSYMVEPKIRLINKDTGLITDIYCIRMSEATSQLLKSDIRSRKNSYNHMNVYNQGASDYLEGVNF